MSDEQGRRDFFKEALSQLMKPVAEFLDEQRCQLMTRIA